MGIFTNWFYSEPKTEFNSNVLKHSIGSIPSGALIQCHGRDFVGFAIRYFESIGDKTDAWDNHSAIFFGSGRHEIVEDTSKGITKNTLEGIMKPDYAFKIWVYRHMSVEQLQKMKDFIYPKIGTKYGWFNIARFMLMDKLGMKIPSIGNPVCSMITAMTYAAANITCSNTTPDFTQPENIGEYVSKSPDWYLFDTYHV